MANSIFSRILVGVDPSDVSTEAVRLAARTARFYGGELVAFHAVDWQRAVAMSTDSAVAFDVMPVIEALRDEGTALLADAVKIATAEGIDAAVRMVEGDPATELLKAVPAEKATLVIMGTHGRGGIRRLVLGSTTEAVLRACSVPVMTMCGQPWPASGPAHAFHRVLLAIDDSEPSDAALDVVLHLPPDPRRELLIDHVVEPYAVPASPVRSVQVEEYRFAQAQTIVDRALERAHDAAVPATGSVDEGRPDETIVSRAIDKEADLIVVGSHGRRGIRRFFLGSVAEKIVRTASVPVLVVRPA